jgi:uncharacterized membrane protein YvbJ
MFCPFCGRQNKDNAVFCDYCGKALPQKVASPSIDAKPVPSAPIPAITPTPNEYEMPKPRLSYNAKRGIITGLLIVVLVVVVLAIYYPSIFHF